MTGTLWYAARRWLPWATSWVGWGVLVFEGDILGVNAEMWAFMFAVTLMVSVVAGVTLKRGPMNLLVALVFVIGAVRSYEYALISAWGPQGVWLVVVAGHLMAWSAPPPHECHLECQNAPTCPARRVDDRRVNRERRHTNVPVQVDRRTRTDRRHLAGV